MPADKGQGSVILKKSAYLQNCESFLDDINTYSPLLNYRSPIMQAKTNNILRELKIPTFKKK